MGALFQGGATVLGVFVPVVAIVFYLAVSVVFIVEPLRRVRIRSGASSSLDQLDQADLDQADLGQGELAGPPHPGPN